MLPPSKGPHVAAANLAPDAFVGTAAAYARYRPPYPRQLLDDMLARAGIRVGGALLDLATGPGRVALALAGSFDTVLAVDLEPEMIEVGRDAAARRGIDNVEWGVGRAEELDLAPETYDLVTIGEAFHRLDGPRVARMALRWLKPGACLATLWSDDVLAAAGWGDALNEVRDRWLARAFPDGWAMGHMLDPTGSRREQVLRDAGFVVSTGSMDEPRTWAFDEIIGYLHSTSVCSRHVLGDDFEAFETELHEALSRISPSLEFREAIRWGYTLARKPGRATT